MADNSSLVKGLIVRAEDARIQGDMYVVRRERIMKKMKRENALNKLGMKSKGGRVRSKSNIRPYAL